MKCIAQTEHILSNLKKQLNSMTNYIIQNTANGSIISAFPTLELAEARVNEYYHWDSINNEFVDGYYEIIRDNKNLISWLETFVDIWSRAYVSSNDSESHQKNMQNALYSFCDEHNLEYMSADELINQLKNIGG
jgi:hypothetical protein